MTFATLSSYNKNLIKREDRLELVEKVFSLQEIPALSEVSLIGAQHILPSTSTMLLSFFDRGLLPENVYLIGKCYSTDLNTYQFLKSIGVNICPSSFEFKKDAYFDDYYTKNIENFARNYLNDKPNRYKKIICIDDGGDLIKTINHTIRDENSFITALEQTSSGYHKIKKLKLNMGVINVARSFAKINIESKIVIKTAIQALCDKINKNEFSPKNTLIIGNGAIGGAMADALEGYSNVYIADTDPMKSTGVYEEYLESLKNFDLIVGCVGKNVISLDKINQMKMGTILISLSSSDREFDIVKLRKSAMTIKSCHDDFVCPNGVRVLNCGFPINFSGNAFEVDIQEFELTRALLAQGILQAINLKFERGLIPLDRYIQKKVVEIYSDKYCSE